MQSVMAIRANGDDSYLLDGGDTLPDLTGIVIDLKKDLVKTPYGVAQTRTAVDAPDTSAFGAWTGVEWKGEDVTFALGRLKATGRAVLWYDVMSDTGKGPVALMRVLNYDVPAKP